MASSSKVQCRSFDMALKLRAVEFAAKNSKEAAARKFDVNSRRIREWCKQKKLLKLKKGGLLTIRKWLSGVGRRALNKDMEEVLFDWIMDLRTWNLRVSRRIIRQQAKSLTEGSLPTHSPSGHTSFPFKANNGWLHRSEKVCRFEGRPRFAKQHLKIASQN